MKRSIILLALPLLFSCASPFSGTSNKAIQARENAADNMLDSTAPNGCSYNQYTAKYMCDDKSIEDPINARVLRTRENIINYLRDSPYITNSRQLGEIVFFLICIIAGIETGLYQAKPCLLSIVKQSYQRLLRAARIGKGLLLMRVKQMVNINILARWNSPQSLIPPISLLPTHPNGFCYLCNKLTYLDLYHQPYK